METCRGNPALGGCIPTFGKPCGISCVLELTLAIIKPEVYGDAEAIMDHIAFNSFENLVVCIIKLH